MNQRLRVIVITVLAVLAGFSAAYAAPVQLSSILQKDIIKYPVMIAQDSQGNLYVSETADDAVRIFDKKGVYLKTLRIARPLGLAIDSAGSIYVCSEKKKRIEVYNADLSFARTLGEAQGDVLSSSIAIDKDGIIYVVDNFASTDGSVRHDTIRVYDSAGALVRSIGSTGSGSGFLYAPGGLAINEARGELYVSDHPLVSKNRTGRIQVFSKSGVYQSTLPIAYDSTAVAAGKITSPSILTLDKTGNLYVLDKARDKVLIFDTKTWASLGTLYSTSMPLSLRQGITIGGDNMAYVTSYSGSRIEVYGLDGYTTMDSGPTNTSSTALAFTGTQSGPNPDSQTISIKNSGSGTLNWTASKDQTWLTINGQPASTVTFTGTTGPASTTVLTVGVDIANLVSGSYNGTVTVTSDFGQKNTIPVTLTVLPAPSMTLSNGWLRFTAKKGKTATPQTVTVAIANVPTLSWWTTMTNLPWSSMNPSAGNATTTATVSVNTTGLAVTASEKPYSGTITFLAPAGTVGNGSTLTVLLDITPVTKINVNTNITEAKFSLAGPAQAAYYGAGASWSVEDAPTGDYTLSYDVVTGYRRPLPQVKSLPSDGDITFSGNYVSWKDLSARRNIITAKGPWEKNDAWIKTYKAADGTPLNPNFMALDSRYGANIASGDVDGDGTAEIITGAGAGPDNSTLVRIYKADKAADKATVFTEFIPYPGMLGGVNVAVADFDGDGKAEVIVAPAGGAENAGKVKIYAYDKGQNKMVATGVEITAHNNLSGVNIGAADTEGNFAPRLITAPVSGTENEPGSVKIWKVDTSKGVGGWTASVSSTEIPLKSLFGATIAAGDTDGDGFDEIVIGVAPERGKENSGGALDSDKSLVMIYKSDGTEVRHFAVFDQQYGANVAAADLDGDGIAEIVVGMGPDPSAGDNSASNDREGRKNKKDMTVKQGNLNGTVRVYGATGVLKYAITPYEDSKYGVKVAVGELGL